MRQASEANGTDVELEVVPGPDVLATAGVQAASSFHDHTVEACQRRRNDAEEAWRAAVAAARHVSEAGSSGSPTPDLRRVAEERVAAAADRHAAAVDRLAAAVMLKRASVDALTGALSRNFGMDALRHEVHRAERRGTGLTLAFVDVDGLKQVNDTAGHAAGDQVLAAVGHEVRRDVRDYDVFVRFGGDEFIVALPDATAAEASGRLDGIRKALASRVPPVSISVGMAERIPGEALESLLRRADADLYSHRQCRRAVPRPREDPPGQ